MTQSGVDVRTPIFYRHSFASALESQSIKTYARLTHTPVIAEHLPRGAASGARIAQYASSHLRSLDELAKLLAIVLDEPTAKAGLSAFNVSAREPGMDEFERTVLSPSSIASVQAAQAQMTKREGMQAERVDGEDGCGTASPGASFAQVGVRRAVSPSGTERKLPRSVSFPADAPSATLRLQRDGGQGATPSTASRPRRLWRRMRGWVWKGKEDETSAAAATATATATAPASPGLPRHHEEGCGAGNASMTSRQHRRDNGASTTSTAAVAPTPSSPAVRVPPWVRAAFTPAAAVTAAATVNDTLASASRGRYASSAQETCTGEDGDSGGGFSTSQSREDVAVSHTVSTSGHTAAPMSGSANGITASSMKEGQHASERGQPHSACGNHNDNENGDAASSHFPSSPHLGRTKPATSYALSSRNTASGTTEPYSGGSGRLVTENSAEDLLRSSGRTAGPPDSFGHSPPPSDTRTLANTSVVSEGRAAAAAQSPWSQGLPLPINTAVPTEAAAAAAAAALVGGEGSGASATQRAGDVAFGPHHRDGKFSRPPTSNPSLSTANTTATATTTTTTTSDRLPNAATTASSSSFAAHHGLWQSGDHARTDAPPRGTTAPHSFLSHPNPNALARWDRHAYAVELVGWLNLLVWVRCQVILFLRDLSGVQGVVAWSAWYWSWAQEHPRQAALHQALSSRRFWRGFWRRGLGAQLSEVQYETSGHMFTLKNAFRLIVTYIGAAYSSLEQLNSAILQIQHHCEMSATPLAAAAVAAAARTYMAGLGSGHLAGAVNGGGGDVSITTRPELGGSVNRAYALGRRDLLSNQNSIFWSPAPAMMTVDDFSPLAPPRSRTDTLGSPQVNPRSAFEDAAEQESAHETVMAEAAEEAEAVSALLVLDKLRNAVWAMLQEQKTIFRSNVRQLDVLESNDFFGWPADGLHADARPAPNASSTQPGALPPYAESVLFSASTRAEGLHPSSPWMRGTAAGGAEESTTTTEAHHHDGYRDDDRPVTARDGAVALLQCVQHSRCLVQRLKVLAQRAHSPPASRHWQRIVVATTLTVPPFLWLYRKTPEELVAIAHARFTVVHQVVRAYLIEPIMQLRESLFYVRPGVEDRRSAFERDAASLANVIRDFHEDMYPNMPQAQLEAMRDRTLDCLRRGVADSEGFGLIDQQYRHSVRHPIRSVVFGDLPRILLIQLSYQALEMSRVANGVDEVLEGNDLNFKVMALMPVFAAGSLLVSWVLFRYRANYKPIRMRMKVLWRSLFRVVSFAGSGQDVSPPFLRGFTQHSVPAVVTGRTYPSGPRSPAPQGLGRGENMTQARRARGRHRTGGGGGGGGTAASAAPRHTAAHGLAEVDPVGFTESSEDEDGASMTESMSRRDGVASVHRLNNYEQGMVLLLSHVIRSMAAEYLRSYEYFHELMEDLIDLESARSSRHQRLSTLERMRATHSSLF